MKKIFNVLLIVLFFTNVIYSKRYSPTIDYMKKDKFRKIFKAAALNIYASNILETEHFKIYYGSSNPATTFWADYNNNNIPDFIDELKTIMEYVYDYEINTLKYKSPFPDSKGIVIVGNTGVKINSNEITIDSKTCGYAMKENGYSLMIVNPIPPSSLFTKSKNMLKVTIAHEFFHLVQFGYSMDFSTASNLWLFEGTAVWMENQVYPDIDDYIYSYAEDLIGNTREGLISDKGFHPYGTALFFDYLSQKFGQSIIKDLWESFANKDTAIKAVKDVIENIYSSSFQQTVTSFYKALLEPEENFSDGDKLSEEDFKIIPENITCNNETKEHIGMLGAVYFKPSCKYTGVTDYDNATLSIDNFFVNDAFANALLSVDETHFIIPFSCNELNTTKNIFYDIYMKNIDNVSTSLYYNWNLIGVPDNVSNMDLLFDKPGIYTVWQWDNETWKIYIPTDKPDLKKIVQQYNIPQILFIESGTGVWINTKSFAKINFSLIKTGKCGINVDFAGSWKISSTNSVVDIKLNYLNKNIFQDINSIWIWDAGKWKIWSNDENIKSLLKQYNVESIEYLTVNRGFWINRKN